MARRRALCDRMPPSLISESKLRRLLRSLPVSKSVSLELPAKRSSRAHLTEIVGVPVRTGFPPKPIAAGAAPETSLSSLGIRSGDSIVVARSTSTKTTASLAKPEPRASQNAPMPSAASFKSDEVAHHSTGPTSSAQTNSPQFVEADGGYVVLRVSQLHSDQGSRLSLTSTHARLSGGARRQFVSVHGRLARLEPIFAT